ncbi:regulatory-associated protein of TOR [Trifolium repens]|nr:regulatory-associated protein of TOR [Trifolium repens]
MKGLTGADARKGTSYGGCQSTRGTFYGRIDALGTMDEGMQATSQLHVGWFAAGFIDGSVRLYDARTPEMAGLELVLDLVCTALGNKFTLVFSYSVVSTLDCPSLIIHYGCVAFRRALVRIKEEVRVRLWLFVVLSTRSWWNASPTRSETINIFDDLELIEMKRKANTQSLKEMATLLRRVGHSEASVDLIALADLFPFSVLTTHVDLIKVKPVKKRREDPMTEVRKIMLKV